MQIMGVTLLAVAAASVAYLSCLLGVVAHEVLGHGLSAVLAGGTFHRFTIGWDGMGWAYTTIPPRTPASVWVLYMASGVIVTTAVGVPLIVWGLLVSPTRIGGLLLIVSGSMIALDGLPYLFFNSVIPRPPGDFGRILKHWQAAGLPAHSVVRWGMAFLGGIGTLAVIYIVTHAIHAAFLTRLHGPGVATSSQSATVLGVFVFLPGALLCYMFKWDQLIRGVGWMPSHALLLTLLVCMGLVWHRGLHSTEAGPDVDHALHTGEASQPPP